MTAKEWKVWKPVVLSIINSKIRKIMLEIKAQRDLRRAAK